MPTVPVTVGLCRPRRRLGLLAVVPLCLASLAGTARAQSERCASPRVEINFLPGQAPGTAAAFGRDIRTAIRAVCEWWGPTYEGQFHIVVDNFTGPSMALIPAWGGETGYIFFSVSMVNRDRAATVHEVTHVFAPNANRFLAEGLAVYAHELLRGPSAFPNFGIDLTVLARRFADKADIASLERIATPSRLVSDGLDERESYIVAGSFVRFLIADFGLPKFRELYMTTPLVPRARNAGDPQRWESIYGLAIDLLAARWRDSLKAR